MNPRELRYVLLAVGVLTIVVNLFIKKEERPKGIAFLMAWLVPGAGHLMLGKWKKGLFLFGLMGATYLFGLWIVGFRAVSFDDNPFYYVGQYGSGATFLLSRLMGMEKAYPRPDLHPSWFDPGLLYICVVGLLNLVLMMNVLDIKLTAPTPSTAAPPPAAVPAPSEPVKPAGPTPAQENPA